MYGFWFRKTIFDAWDHVLGFFAANIGYDCLLATLFLWWHLNTTGALDMPLAVLLMIVSLIALSFYSMLIAVYAHGLLTGAKKGETLRGAGRILKTHVKHIFFHAFIVAIVFINIVFAIPFYMRMGGFAGPLFAFVGLFLSLVLVFNFKYYYPLCLINTEAGVLDAVKYSFAYAMDNKAETTAFLLRNLLDVLLSVPFLGIVPGLAGIQISDMCAALLLNHRYVIAEEKNDVKNRVPWNMVLERMNAKRYMNRRIISLIFPGR